jgi:hypothetical protein
MATAARRQHPVAVRRAPGAKDLSEVCYGFLRTWQTSPCQGRGRRWSKCRWPREHRTGGRGAAAHNGVLMCTSHPIR